MIWTGISMKASTETVFVDGDSWTTQHDIEEVLARHVVSLAPY